MLRKLCSLVKTQNKHWNANEILTSYMYKTLLGYNSDMRHGPELRQMSGQTQRWVKYSVTTETCPTPQNTK